MSAAEVAGLLKRKGLKQVLANMPLQAGSKGLAAVVYQESNYKADFMMGLHFASVCGAPLIHVTAGIVDSADLTTASVVFSKNVSWAIEAARKEGIAVVVEAINQTAVPNYFIRNLVQARWWTTQCPRLSYILDLYHAAVEGLDPAQTVDSYLATSAHFQLAGHPGRHEPDERLLSLIEPGGAIVMHLTKAGLGVSISRPVALLRASNGWIVSADAIPGELKCLKLCTTSSGIAT